MCTDYLFYEKKKFELNMSIDLSSIYFIKINF